MMEAIKLFCFFVFYLLPTVIAGVRKHNQTVAILILNLLLGWTGLGWIVSLVWACTNEPKYQQQQNIYVNRIEFPQQLIESQPVETKKQLIDEREIYDPVPKNWQERKQK